MVFCGVKLELTIVGQKAVLLLLNVGELSIAECEDTRVFKEDIREALEAREELILVLYARAVAPPVFIVTHYPRYAAVFADEDGEMRFIHLSARE